MLKLLNSHTVVFRQYQKKYFILHNLFMSSVAYSNKFQSLISFRFSIFFQKKFLNILFK